MNESRDKSIEEIAGRIITMAINELYINMRYLDNALTYLRLRADAEMTHSIATDGEMLYFNGAYVVDKYLRGRVRINRAYMHVVLHCMLRHLSKKKGRRPMLWDIAADAAVESIIDSLTYRSLDIGPVPGKEIFYSECLEEMPVLTAEGIYYRLCRLNLPDHELIRLHRTFVEDDHSLWVSVNGDDEREERQDRNWRDLSEKTETAMETVFAEEATGGEAVLEQIKAAVRNDVDYSAFLRRFATIKEIMEVDGDAFDYTYYTYGLSIYGNMPLIEPPETKEEHRIEDFVIAVDTSMSTTGDLVREFIAATWAILRSNSTFSRKVNIRIIQCDDRIRSDRLVTDLSGLRDYMEHFELMGGSATDFRPVFEYVDKLNRMGEFSHLRGLIYFTDGMGIYPTKPTPYETAFILLEEPPLYIKMPPWATRLTLALPELRRAREEAARIFANEPIPVDFRDLVQPD